MSGLVDDLIGIPWRRGGRDETGLDCLGAVLLGLRRLGIPTFDPWLRWREAYGRGWRHFDAAVPPGWSLTEAPPEDGDVVFSREGEGMADIGLLVGGRVLTAHKKTGVVLVSLVAIEPRILSRWRHRCRS